jgi:methylmalonyl-CoA/ethylmalonyl-CoA epimerase
MPGGPPSGAGPEQLQSSKLRAMSGAAAPRHPIGLDPDPGLNIRLRVAKKSNLAEGYAHDPGYLPWRPRAGGVMPKRIHHINFIVRDLAAAIPAWERVLGTAVASRDHLSSRGVDIARFRLGSAWLVLVQPVRAGTAPARFLEERGEGFFLLSFGVDSLEAEAQRLGEDWFDGPARDGLDDWRVRDLDGARICGALLQLTEKAREAS